MIPRSISIVGLGKLGAPMVAAFAAKGFKVVGVDINPELVRQLNAGIAPHVEPRLQEYSSRHGARIRATQDAAAAVEATDVTCVIVPTPSDSRGGFDTRYAVAAAREIGRGLRRGNRRHIVCLTSTVLPGATAADFIPTLERYSGKKCGRDFGVAYNPEFIALGSVIHDLLNPDFVLVGESDQATGDSLEAMYLKFCNSPTPPIRRMSIVNAEIVKIALNTFVTTKISYANMLAEFCERVPGAHVDVVTGAIGCDSRIGSRYLRGGLGYAGPCFPRDNRAFSHAARRFGCRLPLAEATDAVNRHQVDRLAALVLAALRPGRRIGIFGLSYKPDTNVVEESQGVALAAALLRRKVAVTVHDPLAMENARRFLGEKVTYARSARQCAGRSELAILLTPWPEYRRLRPVDFPRRPRPVIFDCWRQLDSDRFSRSADYRAIGVGPA